MYYLKMIFFWFVFLWHLASVNKFARKYKRDPNYYPPQQRNDFLIKKTKIFLWFFNIKLNVEGYENIGKGPAILCPNHKSNIDPIVLFYSLKKQTKEQGVYNKIPTFLAKMELTKKRIIKKTLSLLDTFYVDRNDLRQSIKSLNEFGSFVKQNQTFGVIFPEGMRVKEDGLGEFKNGAFKVALSNYLPIVPVAITDTRGSLDKKRWKKFEITVKFLPQIKPNTMLTMEPRAVAGKVKETIHEALVEMKDSAVGIRESATKEEK